MKKRKEKYHPNLEVNTYIISSWVKLEWIWNRFLSSGMRILPGQKYSKTSKNYVWYMTAMLGDLGSYPTTHSVFNSQGVDWMWQKATEQHPYIPQFNIQYLLIIYYFCVYFNLYKVFNTTNKYKFSCQHVLMHFIFPTYQQTTNYS